MSSSSTSVASLDLHLLFCSYFPRLALPGSQRAKKYCQRRGWWSHEKAGQKESRKIGPDKAKLPASPLRASERLLRSDAHLVPEGKSFFFLVSTGLGPREGKVVSLSTYLRQRPELIPRVLGNIWTCFEDEQGSAWVLQPQNRLRYLDSTLGDPSFLSIARNCHRIEALTGYYQQSEEYPLSALSQQVQLTIAALSTINMIGWTWPDRLAQSLVSL